jgi:prepilin-type N-terminal cleavage/methylation domain-containing protein
MQKPQSNRLHPSMRKPCSTYLAGDRGFGLIEVVVAMALIAGAYIGMVETYQRVRLHYGQIEAQRTELNRAQDAHERGAL